MVSMETLAKDIHNWVWIAQAVVLETSDVFSKEIDIYFIVPPRFIVYCILQIDIGFQKCKYVGCLCGFGNPSLNVINRQYKQQKM